MRLLIGIILLLVSPLLFRGLALVCCEISPPKNESEGEVYTVMPIGQMMTSGFLAALIVLDSVVWIGTKWRRATRKNRMDREVPQSTN